MARPCGWHPPATRFLGFSRCVSNLANITPKTKDGSMSERRYKGGITAGGYTRGCLASTSTNLTRLTPTFQDVQYQDCGLYRRAFIRLEIRGSPLPPFDFLLKVEMSVVGQSEWRQRLGEPEGGANGRSDDYSLQDNIALLEDFFPGLAKVFSFARHEGGNIDILHMFGKETRRFFWFLERFLSFCRHG